MRGFQCGTIGFELQMLCFDSLAVRFKPCGMGFEFGLFRFEVRQFYLELLPCGCDFRPCRLELRMRGV